MKYDIVYADPPWQQNKGGLRKCRPNQKRELDYTTLSLEEIKNIIKKYDANILFMWTIDKYLFNAEKIAKDLGYNLHARIIWDKTNGIAPAFTIRFCHEYLLWFYKKFIPIDKKQRGRWKSVITEKSTKHSVKPNIVYNMIESFYPDAKKIELFARERYDGWDCFGNELSNTIQRKINYKFMV